MLVLGVALVLVVLVVLVPMLAAMLFRLLLDRQETSGGNARPKSFLVPKCVPVDFAKANQQKEE
jgi:hypothetical protein